MDLDGGIIPMNVKFTGTFEELKEKLSSLGGSWNDAQPSKKVLRLNGGVLSWFNSTGTLQFQGRSPGLEQLETAVLHLLYPEEYELPKAAIKPEATAVQEVHPRNQQEETPERQYLSSKFKDTELVFGIVNAVGTEYKRVLDPLTDRLKGFGYKVKEIRVSSLLPQPTVQSNLGEYDRIKHFMERGNRLRQETKNYAILAAGAAHKIKELRNDAQLKTAYIINSLKHPDEVEFLRKVYGDGFYLLGIHVDEKRRRAYLENDKSLVQKEVEDLIRIDEDERVEDEDIEYGQNTRDTFHLSDFFVSLGKNDDHVKNTIQRFLELLFSNPFKNPTFDEFAMFMAFNSSIRSSDLSRQVGAIIARGQQIIATGANDTPRYGGGQYWAEVNPETGEIDDAEDGKDYTKGRDSNKIAQKEIIEEIASSLIRESLISSDRKEATKAILAQSKISDLTEFGRVVHAEMEAVLSCARIGISTINTTLYCTTFPCHNCAKHIVDAGMSRVVYVEPYPKSRALDLHSDTIILKTNSDSDSERHVTFEPFTGVGARRFLDLFSMSLGAGPKLRRKDKQGDTLDWQKGNAVARTPLLPKSYLEVESAASDIWQSAQAQHDIL
jgi:deoxycytidylate deaminase